MENNYQEQWAVFLQKMREGLASMVKEPQRADHLWEVWFSGLTFCGYNAEQNAVTMGVPSPYVYEYLEQYYVRLLAWSRTQSFGEGVRLQYKVAKPEPSFADVAEYLSRNGYNPRRDPYNIRILNAHKRMEDGLRHFLGDGYQWLPAYDRVASWLTDNKGRGLLCVGTSGLGKTLLCRDILPVIIGNGGNPIPFVNAAELNARCDELKKERIVIIDDLGHEPRKHYGDVDNSFFEICNNAERNGNLLIITTNLSTNTVNPAHPDAALYPDSIDHRYGREVLDRLKVITSVAIFKGASLRACTSAATRV